MKSDAITDARNLMDEAHSLYAESIRRWADSRSTEDLRDAQHNWSQYLFWQEAVRILQM